MKSRDAERKEEEQKNSQTPRLLLRKSSLPKTSALRKASLLRKASPLRKASLLRKVALLNRKPNCAL